VPLQLTKPIAPADVNSIAAAIINYSVPEDGKLGARPIKGRQLYVDQAAFLQSIRPFVDGPVPTSLVLPRPFVNARGPDVYHCGPTPKACHIENDGIIVKAVAVAFDPVSGRLDVRTTVDSNRGSVGFWGTNSFIVGLFVAKRGRDWKVVARSSYTAE